jgi:hypothetical protein
MFVFVTDDELKRMSRGERRKAKKRLRQYHRGRYELCEYCGGDQQWCYTCGTWTRTCCVPYGTCMCS